MLTKEEIIAAIGPEEYQAACAEARKTAPGTGTERGRTRNHFLPKVPHEIAELIWGRWSYKPKARHDDDETDVDKIELIFLVYQDMPCFSFMSSISMHDTRLSSEAKQAFWKHVRSILSQEDAALADPISYMLWCDYFEHADKLEEAWTALTQDLSNTKLLHRMLRASGPVPFGLKEALYAQLIHDKACHVWIYASLLRSRFDLLGRINIPKARELLKQLDLPEDTPSLALLRETLEQDEDVPEGLPQLRIKEARGMMSKFISSTNNKDSTTR